MNEIAYPDERRVVNELVERGVFVQSLSDIAWQYPQPDAIPVLLRAIEDQIDPGTKLLALIRTGEPWAEAATYPHILDLFKKTSFARPKPPGSPSEQLQADFDYNLVARVANAPAKYLWPAILQYARRRDLGSRASLFLRRAGKFRTHSDEVLALYEDFVGSDSIPIEMSITEGLRALGDPRGVDLLTRVNDLNSSILREKARTLDRLRGRD